MVVCKINKKLKKKKKFQSQNAVNKKEKIIFVLFKYYHQLVYLTEKYIKNNTIMVKTYNKHTSST